METNSDSDDNNILDRINLDVNDEDNVENLKLKLNFTNKMLKNKEDTLQVLEGSLKFSRNQVSELTRCYNLLQNDRDEKVMEILNLQRTINSHMRTIEECKTSTINDDILFHKLDMNNEMHEYEIDGYKCEIESLKFDLGVMEDLYKVCTEEIIKQEKTINLLRQAVMDRNMETFNLKVENDILISKLREKDKIIECRNCKNAMKTLNEVDQEWPAIIKELNVLKDVLTSEEKKNTQLEYLLQRNMKENERIKRSNISLMSNVNNFTKLLADNRRKTKCMKVKHCKVTNSLRLKIEKLQDKLKKSKSSNNILQEKINFNENHIQMLQEELAKMIQYCRDDYSTKEVIKSLQDKTEKFESRLFDMNKTNEELKGKLNSTQDAINLMQEKYKSKNDSISWLEIQLGESTVKGKEMCLRSQEVFECVRKLLKQVKDERKSMIKKINRLESVNRLLNLRRDFGEDGNSDFYIDN